MNGKHWDMEIKQAGLKALSINSQHKLNFIALAIDVNPNEIF
jgi:hypothetical protein